MSRGVKVGRKVGLTPQGPDEGGGPSISLEWKYVEWKNRHKQNSEEGAPNYNLFMGPKMISGTPVN